MDCVLAQLIKKPGVSGKLGLIHLKVYSVSTLLTTLTQVRTGVGKGVLSIGPSYLHLVEQDGDTGNHCFSP